MLFQQRSAVRDRSPPAASLRGVMAKKKSEKKPTPPVAARDEQVPLSVRVSRATKLEAKLFAVNHGISLALLVELAVLSTVHELTTIGSNKKAGALTVDEAIDQMYQDCLDPRYR